MWNMNALGNFTSLTGKEMSDITGKVDINTLRSIAWCSAIEGEEADGKELGLDEKAFGRLMDMATIIKFSEILTVQTGGAGQKKSEAPDKRPKMFRR